MLEHLGRKREAAFVLNALKAVRRDGTGTVDIGGSASTAEMGNAGLERVGRIVRV